MSCVTTRTCRWSCSGPTNRRRACVNISGAGVTANADNADGAQRLLEWLATDGQEALVDDNLEYPVNAEVAPDPILVDFGDFTEQTIDATAYADLNSDAVELLALAGYR